MTRNEGSGAHVAGGDRDVPLHVPWSDPKPKTVSITWPDLTPAAPPATDTKPTKKDKTMAEDIHGECIGDERVTYSRPPVLNPKTPQLDAGIKPLPAFAIEAARLLADTEGHPDATVRSARKIAAQALEHLHVLVRAAADRGALPETKPAKKATRKKVATPSDDGPVAKTVRAWAAENGVECPSVGRVPRAVVEQYMQAKKGR